MQIKNILSEANVNNVTKSKLNNVNNVTANEQKCKNTAYEYNIKEVQNTAARLVDKLNDPESHNFFCKVAWKLPERFIWVACEQALTGRNPKAYFTFLCNLELKKMGA